MNPSRFACIAAALCLVGLFAAVYAQTMGWLYERFVAPDTYYSHGFLIPVVSGYLIWMRRKEIARCRVVGSMSGFCIMAGALLLHFAAMAAGIYSLSGYSMGVFIAGVVLYLFRRRDCQADQISAPVSGVYVSAPHRSDPVGQFSDENDLDESCCFSVNACLQYPPAK